MNAPITYHADPVVRKNLDFKLHHIPRFWFGGDAFRTRFFDAVCLTFPDGERYFIESIRQFREKIIDVELKNKVTTFIRQEAQHGIAHEKMNQLMIEQGMPIANFTAVLQSLLRFELKFRSPRYNLAMTAAAEHLTALMADAFYSKKSTLSEADPYIRALLAWHAIEEMEHRDVAFDVMQQVGQVSESTRKLALITTTLVMFGFTLYRTNVMLRYDGYSQMQRLALFYHGLPWFFGKNGVLNQIKAPYLSWYKQGFHPSQHPIIRQYKVWVELMEKTGDPILAGNAFWEAGL